MTKVEVLKGLKEFTVTNFLEDTEIKDDTCFSGPSTVQGSFKAFSILLKNDFTAKNKLESTKGSINAKANLQVGSNLISSGDIIVQKNCHVGGSIEGKNVSLLGLNTSTQYIQASKVRLRGSITIKNGINASKSISLILNPRRRKVKIEGVIEAPHITIIFGGFFTKWLTLQDKMFKRVGRDVRVKKMFNIENLIIKTDKLSIKTNYPPKRVEIDFKDSIVEAKEIEYLKL